MISNKEILNFIEFLEVKKKRDFIKYITKIEIKASVFNLRFFDGRTFTSIGKEVGISDAMAKHIFRDLLKRITKHIYESDKQEEYKQSSDNQNIILEKLPFSNRLANLSKCYTYLHEFSLTTKQEFWENRGCGLKSLNELMEFMKKFGIRFLDHDKELIQDFSRKE